MKRGENCTCSVGQNFGFNLFFVNVKMLCSRRSGVLSQQVQIKINMQGKTSESCDFLELQVTNKFEKSTKQNLSLEKSLQNTNKKKNVLFVIKRKNKN